uniref:SH3 domain containing 19 n=1 Tax=Oryzias sinensis TaxID=183150 RepID=A0A8C8E4C1_9TELE
MCKSKIVGIVQHASKIKGCTCMNFFFFVMTQPPPSYDQVIQEKNQKEHITKPTAAPRRSTCTTTSATQTDQPYLEELEKADSSHTHRRSITVFWQIQKKHLPAAPTETSASTSEKRQRPIPRPRTKSQKQTTKAEIKVLPEASPSSDITQPDSLDVFTKKLSDELLEIFDEGHQFAERFDEQLGQTTQVGDALGEMSDPFSQRNIRSKIQAFEVQNGTEGGNESARPNPLARRATTKPPVAAKPSLPFRSMDDSQNIPATPNPKPAPKAMPLRKPVGMSVREQLEALHSNGSIQQQPIYALPTRANSRHEEEPSPTPPVPPVKPFKQPLKPNLNINNHNSVSMSRESDLVDGTSNNVHMKSQYNVDINGSFVPRQSTARRPTTIRVPSKMPSSESIMLVLPLRKPSMNKPLPPRPPSGKVGPGRPPPPKFGATNRAPSISLQPPPKHQEIKPNKTEMVLPPRPRPGHYLYNKYILELPHAIAALDYDGCNIGELSFEKDEVLLLLEKVNNNEYLCQAGEVIGRVHKSHLKIITPLESYSSPVYVPASGGDSCGLTVKAIYDFQPQNPEELSLRVGDVVTGVEQADDQWYRGTCRGSTGFFPINYAEVLSNSPVPEKREKPSLASISGPRCVARFDFEGEHSDELTFFEGDVIQLQKYVGEEWAQGQIGASIGIFPLNFVEVVEDLPPPPTQQLNQMFVPGEGNESISAAAATSKPNEWAVALHDYAAKTSSDLSFRQGDRILMTKHLDEKWSCGKLNGREGMFPRIYVQTVIEGRFTF